MGTQEEYLVTFDAGEVVSIDADERGLVFHHITGAVTIVPHAVLKKFFKFA